MSVKVVCRRTHADVNSMRSLSHCHLVLKKVSKLITKITKMIYILVMACTSLGLSGGGMCTRRPSTDLQDPRCETQGHDGTPQG